MNIKGKKVTLRAMEKSDCEMVREMFNDPEIENLVVGWAFPVSNYAQEKWLENHYSDNLNFRFIIETPDDGAVGIATLTGIDWKNRRATHGIKLINMERRSKGIGTDTVMAIMRYAFDELQLNRLDGSWFQDNMASIGLYKKCGWVEEGIRRNYVFKNGGYRNLVVVGILAEEYHKLIEENHYWD
jgi:RimJ/RimL family protein N-acetyltransferase